VAILTTETQSGKGHRIIEKLNTFLTASPLACQFRLFPCRHAVDPEPAEDEKKYDQE
jgi:hypothetical protein